MLERVPEPTAAVKVGENFESWHKSYPRCSIRLQFQMSCV